MLSIYHKKILQILARDPFKLKGLLRLRTGGEHARGKYYLRSDGMSAPPITVAIRPSYRCNLRCIQCGQWGEHGIFRDISPEELTKEELSADELKNFIKEISPFSPYIYFTGGEPLLHNDIFELIHYASSHHLITSLSSNSTLLSDRANDVVASGLDYFYSSLDAPDCLNNQIRAGVDSFEKTVTGIRALIEARKKKGGLPLLQLQTIIVKENQHKLYEMAKFVDEELHADVWGLQLLVFTTPDLYKRAQEIYRKKFGISCLYWKGFLMDSTQGFNYNALEEELRRIKRGRWKFRLRLYKPLNLPDFNFKTYFEKPEELMVEPPCMYPWAFAQIQPNGDVAICGSQPEYIIGNIRRENFEKIWNGEKAVAFRKCIRENLLPVCCRCFGLHIFSGYK